MPGFFPINQNNNYSSAGSSAAAGASAGAGASAVASAAVASAAGAGSSFLQPITAKEAIKSTQSIMANNFFISFSSFRNSISDFYLRIDCLQYAVFWPCQDEINKYLKIILVINTWRISTNCSLLPALFIYASL